MRMALRFSPGRRCRPLPTSCVPYCPSPSLNFRRLLNARSMTARPLFFPGNRDSSTLPFEVQCLCFPTYHTFTVLS